MTRFRTKGTNWEGRPWDLAPCLVTLGHQIEGLFPDPQPGDGTVASRTHDQVSPNSDHRPRPFEGKGVVRAIDVGETPETATQGLVDAIVAGRDPRMMYLIYEGRSIWSVPHNGFAAWTWQPYGGPSPHKSHFHLSTVRSGTVDSNDRPWSITLEDGMCDCTKDEILEKIGVTAAAIGRLNQLEVAAQAERPITIEGAMTRLFQMEKANDFPGAGGGAHDHDGRYLKAVEGKK